MTLSTRDRTIVRHAIVFGQFTAEQIHQLVFTDVGSRTPVNRALKRLVASGYLWRNETQRLAGGARGGSGQYYYQAGRRGFGLYRDGSWRPARNPDYHQLLLVDTFLSLKQLERAGHLTINQASTGEDAVVTHGSIELRPDMSVDVTTKNGSRLGLLIEVDMATEGRKQIQDKLVRYWEVFGPIVATEGWDAVPRVPWVACDAERARELSWIIEQGKDDEAKRLYKVTTLGTFSNLLVGG